MRYSSSIIWGILRGLYATATVHAKEGEARENGTSKASPPHQNVAGTHAPQMLASSDA